MPTKAGEDRDLQDFEVQRVAGRDSKNKKGKRKKEVCSTATKQNVE
jgi:hypothetical protein